MAIGKRRARDYIEAKYHRRPSANFGLYATVAAYLHTHKSVPRFASQAAEDKESEMIRRKVLFTAALLLASLPGLAQQNYDRSRGQDRNGNRASQYRGSQNFYRGVREGGHGGQYYDQRHASDGYDERFNQRRGGIGPGQGAAIGGAGGAILGAILGGGLKGSLIGGAAGAGIGAVVGESAQNRRNDSRERR